MCNLFCMRIFSDSNDFGGRFLWYVCKGYPTPQWSGWFEGKTTILIFCNSVWAQHFSKQINMKAFLGYDKNNKMPFYLIPNSKIIHIQVQSEAWVLIYAKLHELIVIRPERKLLQKLKNQLCQVLKDEVATSALINPKRQTQSTLTIQVVLGLVAEHPTRETENNNTTRFVLSLSSVTSEEKTKRPLEIFKLDHQPPERRQVAAGWLSSIAPCVMEIWTRLIRYQIAWQSIQERFQICITHTVLDW